jgi:hypothetical protein
VGLLVVDLVSMIMVFSVLELWWLLSTQTCDGIRRHFFALYFRTI